MPDLVIEKSSEPEQPRDIEAELDAAIAAHTFHDEDDWLAWPSKGFGIPYYCPIRFLAYLNHFGITHGTPPNLPDWGVQEDREWWQVLSERGVAVPYTYFAKGRITGRIKIGRSKQPEYRIGQLGGVTNGEPADKLIILRGGHLEKAYHNAFGRWHHANEWFAPHPDIFAEIERLEAADLRAACKPIPAPFGSAS